MVYCESCGIVPVPDDQLPVELPYDVEFTGREGNPLSRTKAFVETTCPQLRRAGAARDRHHGHLRRQLLVLPALPLAARTTTRIFDPELADRGLPVDQYIGGIEHAILHLLYARFICRVLHDFGLVRLRGAVHATCSTRG